MDEIIELLKEYLGQSEKIITYMNLLQARDKEYYRRNQEILYVGIVNRTYSLWETFCKDLIFCYYELVKNNLISKGELTQKLKLNELPGYIVETGIIQDNYISYELKKDFITYTSKNIGYNELSNLFSRFDITVSELKTNKRIKEYIEANNAYFDIQDFSKDYLKDAIGRLTAERNKVSHYSSIDDYQELPAIQVWAQLFQILANELAAIVCNYYVNQNIEQLDRVGVCVKYLKKQEVLCIDINKGAFVDKKSMLIVRKNGNIKYLLRPMSFQVNNQDKISVQAYDKAGIKVLNVFDESININSGDEVLVMNNVF